MEENSKSSFIALKLVGYVFEGTQDGKPCLMMQILINGKWETHCLNMEGNK